jgi:hypothetical protein
MIDAGLKGWLPWKLGLLLYPFVTAAVAINVFMLGLMFPEIGIAALTPETTLLLSLPLGVPFTWAAALWVRRLIAAAER